MSSISSSSERHPSTGEITRRRPADDIPSAASSAARPAGVHSALTFLLSAPEVDDADREAGTEELAAGFLEGLWGANATVEAGGGAFPGSRARLAGWSSRSAG